MLDERPLLWHAVCLNISGQIGRLNHQHKEVAMEAEPAKKIIGILMESEFYFELTPKERCELVQHLLETLSAEGNA